MNTKDGILITLVILLIAMPSTAGINSTSGDTPFVRSSLTEVDPLGHENDRTSVKVLTLNRNLQTEKPSAFVLSELIRCPDDKPCAPLQSRERRFKIEKTSVTQCGSIHYVAQETTPYLASVVAPSLPSGRLDVMDHSGRVCQDDKKHDWEVWLADYPQPTKLFAPKSRYFYGNEEQIADYEGCIESVSHIACTMLYLPSLCSARSIDSGQTRIGELLAEGPNACQASVQLKTKACKIGYAPDRFQGLDIVCIGTSIPLITAPQRANMLQR